MSLTEECLKANQYDQVEGESASQFFLLLFLSLLNKHNPFTLRFGSLNSYKTKLKEARTKTTMQQQGK